MLQNKEHKTVNFYSETIEFIKAMRTEKEQQEKENTETKKESDDPVYSTFFEKAYDKYAKYVGVMLDELNSEKEYTGYSVFDDDPLSYSFNVLLCMMDEVTGNVENPPAGLPLDTCRKMFDYFGDAARHSESQIRAFYRFLNLLGETKISDDFTEKMTSYLNYMLNGVYLSAKDRLTSMDNGELAWDDRLAAILENTVLNLQATKNLLSKRKERDTGELNANDLNDITLTLLISINIEFAIYEKLVARTLQDSSDALVSPKTNEGEDKNLPNKTNWEDRNFIYL